jgi:hypothetical protein
MTYEQLKANYTVAYRIIVRERALRDNVFATSDERDADMAEMDKLLEILDDMKNFCKLHVDPEPEQPRLIDVAPRYEY